MSRYLYLVIDVSAVIVPFFFSFHPRLNFSQKWRSVWPALLWPAILFMIWDECFTQTGIWGFNARYLTGIYFGSLPLEELLFFIFIPYACLFTYDVTNYFIKKDILAPYRKLISWILIIPLLVTAILNADRWYTVTTFTGLAVFIFVLQFLLKAPFLSRFYVAFIFMLVPFFIVNGILTGSFIEEEVVWYNGAENLGLRLGTIPVEDIFYGALLILMNIAFFEWRQRRPLPVVVP